MQRGIGWGKPRATKERVAAFSVADKKKKRMKNEPLLSDAEVIKIMNSIHGTDWNDFEHAIEQARDFYEDLLEKGVLRKVEEVSVDDEDEGWEEWYGPQWVCQKCRFKFMTGHKEYAEAPNFCPGCGGKVKHDQQQEG